MFTSSWTRSIVFLAVGVILVVLCGCSSLESPPADTTGVVGAGGSAGIGFNTAGSVNSAGASEQTSVTAGSVALTPTGGSGGSTPITGSGGSTLIAGSGGMIPTEDLDGGIPTATLDGSTPTTGSGGQSSNAGAGGSNVTPADGCVVSSIPDDIRSTYQIKDFYQKYASANGVIVATSPNVGDEAIIKDCQLLLEMYSNETLRQSIISQKYFFTLIAESEQLSNIPEVGGVYGTMMDIRARGLGSMKPTICAEDSILCMPSDRWRGDCICPHEYGHTLADIAIGRGDPAMASRLEQITNDIRASGRLANAYVWQDGATSGMIAWGVQAWYNCAVNGTNGGYHSDVNTRQELKSVFPDLHDFLAEILPEDNQYVDCYFTP